MPIPNHLCCFLQFNFIMLSSNSDYKGTKFPTNVQYLEIMKLYNVLPIIDIKKPLPPQMLFVYLRCNN